MDIDLQGINGFSNGGDEIGDLLFLRSLRKKFWYFRLARVYEGPNFQQLKLVWGLRKTNFVR